LIDKAEQFYDLQHQDNASKHCSEEHVRVVEHVYQQTDGNRQQNHSQNDAGSKIAEDTSHGSNSKFQISSFKIQD
jgi:hypothetical protein